MPQICICFVLAIVAIVPSLFLFDYLSSQRFGLFRAIIQSRLDSFYMVFDVMKYNASDTFEMKK